MSETKTEYLIILLIASMLSACIFSDSCDRKSSEALINNYLNGICIGNRQVRYDSLGNFGHFKKKFSENKWLCQYLPIKLKYIPNNSSEHIYVSDIFENVETNRKCEFIISCYDSFLKSEYKTELYCADRPEDYEFFMGPGLTE